MPAYYNGNNLGFIFEMSTAANPNARQINVYPGADGLEVIDQGTRGGTTSILGALIASSGSALAAAEGRFRSLQVDGRPFVLEDDLGTIWNNVILVAYQPRGRIFAIATLNGYVTRRYTAEFLHI